MSIYVLCLTTNGLPIFTRKKGDCENLPFSTVASLNGFHMFFKSLDVTLQTTYAEDWTYIWNDFHNVITLIICGRNLSETVLKFLSKIIFGSFSLFISRDEFSHPALLERMKKEAKNYMPIVDSVMESCLTQILGFSNCILATENAQLLQRLNEFSNQCGSLFCCLIVSQCIAVASEGWWDLDIIDRELLQLFFISSNTLQNEKAVYLPCKNPNLAYRFISIPITANSALCVICGTEPTNRELHTIAQNIFRTEANLLIQNVERCIPRCITDSIVIDANAHALILLNSNTRKCVFTRNLQQHSNSTKRLVGDGLQRFDILIKFLDQTLDIEKLFDKKYTEIIDQHWCSDNYKCYSHTDGMGNVIFILFIASIPTHNMRYIAAKILTGIVQDKNVCW